MFSSQATPLRQHDYGPATSGRTDALRPRVLVLLATYNGSRWIREQIETVLAQEGVDVQITVRDDASTDGTRLELARFVEEDDRVKVVAATAPSGSAGQNFLTLIRENPATPFDFVAFADQDDLWNPDKLIRACSTLAASASAGYSSATVALWADGRQRTLKISGAPTRTDFLFEGAGQGCTFVLTAAFYERVRSFLATQLEATRGLHYHDWLVYALARSWGLQWRFDAKPSMKYRQHPKNDTGARGTARGAVRRLSLIRQGWYRTQLHTIAKLCTVAAPTNTTLVEWHRQLARTDSWDRRLRIARFCLRGGRRRARDNLIAMFAALAGWI